MVGLGTAPVNADGTGGGSRLTIAMAPPAIGMVSIQIDRTVGGGTVVAIAASHPATLASLQNDHAALAQMLTQAGVPLDHRTISFHLDPVPAEPNPAAGQATFSQAGTGGGFNQASGRQSGNQANDPARFGSTPRADDFDLGASFARGADHAGNASQRMRRFGVNMMA